MRTRPTQAGCGQLRRTPLADAGAGGGALFHFMPAVQLRQNIPPGDHRTCRYIMGMGIPGNIPFHQFRARFIICMHISIIEPIS
ncbi:MULTISPECIES: hypothetical protein [Nocardia]|uniref:hypothetical protein n=1 Tax=Nocardia TaxID=1817 RepID=UPI002453DDD1|nr:MULTISPECIES: hypothetical protein [Nocardia]